MSFTVRTHSRVCQAQQLDISVAEPSARSWQAHARSRRARNLSSLASLSLSCRFWRPCQLSAKQLSFSGGRGTHTRRSWRRSRSRPSRSTTSGGFGIIHNPDALCPCGPRKVDVRLPGKAHSNSHGARPVHLTERVADARTRVAPGDPVNFQRNSQL